MVTTVVPIVVVVSLLAVLAVVGVYWKSRRGAAPSTEGNQVHVNEVTRSKPFKRKIKHNEVRTHRY